MRTHTQRRGTILLMVVTLLALLFVIVTGFLAITRNDRNTYQLVARAEGVDGVNEVIRDQLVEKIIEPLAPSGRVLDPHVVNPDGSVGVSDTYLPVDIPGSGPTSHLGSSEPVWLPVGDPRATGIGGLDFRGAGNANNVMPLLTRLSMMPSQFELGSITQGVSRNVNFVEMLIDTNRDGLLTVNLAGGPGALNTDDLRANARLPLMDADGDGMPDSDFVFTARLTEQVNALAGTPVTIPRFREVGGAIVPLKPYIIPSNTTFGPFAPTNASTFDKLMKNFDENGRYVVAARVVSHGGMVTLDSPAVYDAEARDEFAPWNREFSRVMFNTLRNPRDNRVLTVPPVSGNDPWNPLFSSIRESREGVEAALRRRGGVLGGYRGESASDPAVMNLLQQEDWFQATLQHEFTLPTLQTPRGLERGAYVPRINLTDMDQVEAWTRAVALNPVAFNNTIPAGPGAANINNLDLLTAYCRSRLMTTTNNSDELAPQQIPAPVTVADTQYESFNLPPGATKFYLGAIDRAFDADGDGVVEPGERQFLGDGGVGDDVVRELAAYFEEMLASHQGWRPNNFPLPIPATGLQEVTRREQALMLAVNTIAFATPRIFSLANPGVLPAAVLPGEFEGFIEPVWYTDGRPSRVMDRPAQVYCGYAPQPVFSEVVIVNPDPNDASFIVPEQPLEPNEIRPPPDSTITPELTLAVELYNPYASADFADVTHRGGLPFAQYAISVGATSNPNLEPDGSTWTSLRGAGEFSGVTHIPPRGFSTFTFSDGGAPAIRSAFKNITLTALPSPDSASNYIVKLWRCNLQEARVPTSGRWFCVDEIKVAAPNKGEWKSRSRDAREHRTSTNDNAFASAGLPDARWSMFVDDDDDTSTAVGSGQSSPGSTWINQPVQRAGTSAAATPMITLNGGFGEVSVYGANRPAAFPTVGMMLFLPRFAHVHDLPTVGVGQPPIAPNDRLQPILGTRPMTHYLREEWQRQNPTGGNPAPGSYPVDFGHMPIFDNDQNPATAATRNITMNRDAGAESVFNKQGALPWGLQVFDYFTTLDPTTPGLDPLRVPGRININVAPWYIMAQLPILNPRVHFDESTASPEFWSDYAGIMVDGLSLPGRTPVPLPDASTPHRRFLPDEARPGPGIVLRGGGQGSLDRRLPDYDPTTRHAFVGLQEGDPTTWIRLGPYLAQAACAYRDGVPYLPLFNEAALPPTAPAWALYATAFARNQNNLADPGSQQLLGNLQVQEYRDSDVYGEMRGQRQTLNPSDNSDNDMTPTEGGFLSIGELINVKGFDSTNYAEAIPPIGHGDQISVVDQGDFVRAVSLMALLDSHFLTTRSNTFTVYYSVMDREEPQNSFRGQVTVDRSRLLPQDIGGAAAQPGGSPEIISERRVGYFNSQYDN